MHRTDEKNKRIAVLLLAAIVLQTLARSFHGFAEWYASRIYPWMLRILGGISNLFPFALDECVIYLMLFGTAGYLLFGIYRIWKKETRLSAFLLRTGKGVLKLGVLWLFAFTVTCGINYHRTPFSTLAGLPMEPSTVEELEGLCLWLTERIEEVSRHTKVQEDGRTALPDGLQEKTTEAMTRLGDTYEELAGW